MTISTDTVPPRPRPTLRSLATRTAVVAVAAAGVFGLSAGTAQAAPAYASYWGAIAFSPSTGSVGYSYDYPTLTSANGAARRYCRVRDCQVVVSVDHGCAALAQARNRALGWAWSGSLADAKNRAAGATRSRNARILTAVCTTGHR
jgi:serine/threonine-protein kinase